MQAPANTGVNPINPAPKPPSILSPIHKVPSLSLDINPFAKSWPSPPSYKDIYTVEATAYTGDTITATGTTPTHNPDGISTIAVDPTIIPLGSRVYIPGYGEAIASDTGLAIKGNKIDLFLNSEKECIDFGKQNVTLYVLSYPE